nr:hypothetical protein [Tanacetum cinerariifolium]
MSNASSTVTYTSPVALPSLDYVPRPEHPSSPDNVPSPEHPPLPVEIPYVPEPEYPEYLAPSDDGERLEDQPLPTNALPIAALPDYVADSDPQEDPEDDQVDYTVDGGVGDDEPFDDDDDDDDDDTDSDLEEDPFKDEEEHLAPVDSSAVPIIDLVPPTGDIKALEADEPTPTPTPRLPHIIIPISQTCLHRARKTVRPEPSMAAGMRMRALLLSTSHKTDILEADVPPWKRLALPLPLLDSGAGKASYGITNTWDEIVDILIEIAPTTLEGVDRRVTELDTIVRDRQDHRCTVMILDREAMYAREAWAGSEDKNSAIAAHVRTLEAQVAALIGQTSSLQTQLTTALGCIEILEAKDPEPQGELAEAGSSWTLVYLLAISVWAIMYGYQRCYKMAPKKRTTRATPATTTTPTTTITDAQLQALIDRGIAAVLVECDADRSRNGDNSNDSGTGGRRFVGYDITYAMPWVALKRMIKGEYYLRGETQKLESEYCNLRVKGLDLLIYNHCFQELALMCDRMFSEEAAKVESTNYLEYFLSSSLSSLIFHNSSNFTLTVLDLEKTKTAQAKEIVDLKKRVKKLERKRRSRTLRMNIFKIGTSRRRSLGEDDASKQGRNLKQSGEARLKLKELMKLCTKLSDRVLDLEKTKTAQAKEIVDLKKRVKKLERKRRSRTLR